MEHAAPEAVWADGEADEDLVRGKERADEVFAAKIS